MSAFPFGDKGAGKKSKMAEICQAERERQWRQLIMIPSESMCHPAAAEVLSSELGNVYAEGLPQPLLCPNPREAAPDLARFEGWQMRLSDRRFYKGTIGANRAELAAQDNIAKVFAKLEGSPAADDIYVNVQALSGAAANLSVYEALLTPGDGMMGLDLSQGGHLTHGSQFNFSGKTFNVHSYGVLPGADKLDYKHVREEVLKYRPKILIGGASAYPWDFDWKALREIADEVGAYLLADVAHLAGMIAAGLLANPVPYAHVVTFTTHKTLCGPRGAVILTTDPRIAQKVDMAVFPGMQGGPHMNSIAGIGRLFEAILEDYDAFCNFQRKVIGNTASFARCMKEEGFELEYGGTNTHMVLVDLKGFRAQGEVKLDGETAARMLEMAGIVCNKNMLPGDIDAAHASGLRFGMPWLTQRGISETQIKMIAKIIKEVLSAVYTFSVVSPGGEEKCRGRVAWGVLQDGARETEEIVAGLPYPLPPEVETERRRPSPMGNRTMLLLRGEKAKLALAEMVTARLPIDGSAAVTLMLRANGKAIDEVVVKELKPVGGQERWVVACQANRAGEVARWIGELSDGYLMFDEADLQAKIDGPTVVEELDARELSAEERRALEQAPGAAGIDLTKPYFIGQRAMYAQAKLKALPEYVYAPKELPLRKTVLNAIHHEMGAKMVPFAGWEMPVFYPAGIFAEHKAVRSGAGLFDVSHMSVLEVKGKHALAFMDQMLANCVSRLSPGQAQYSYILRPDGTAVDDLFVYRLESERFLIVSNASNAEAVIDWITAVNTRGVLVDKSMPAKMLDGPVEFRALRDAGKDSLVGVALQGPTSMKVLVKMAGSTAGRAALQRMKPNDVTSVELAGIPTVVAHTGYTGEKMGFEIMMHPAKAAEFWKATLEAGKLFGAMAAGLGARDSTRLEAGLPLFGHELEGALGISLTEAGYGFVPRFHVPFFIGREPYMERVNKSRRHLVRLGGQGRKSLRAGHAIVDAKGRAVGEVTSFAYTHEDMTFVVLACVEHGFRPAVGEKVTGVRVSVAQYDGKVEERNAVELKTLERFPTDEDRDGWAARYK